VSGSCFNALIVTMIMTRASAPASEQGDPTLGGAVCLVSRGSGSAIGYNGLGNRRLSASERIRHKGHYPLYMGEGQAGAASRISVCPAAVWKAAAMLP
jgi:hypothetical protein